MKRAVTAVLMALIMAGTLCAQDQPPPNPWGTNTPPPGTGGPLPPPPSDPATTVSFATDYTPVFDPSGVLTAVQFANPRLLPPLTQIASPDFSKRNAIVIEFTTNGTDLIDVWTNTLGITGSATLVVPALGPNGMFKARATQDTSDCLQWKAVLAYKGHSGWNGFLSLTNKYLSRHTRMTQTNWNNGSPTGVMVFNSQFDESPLDGEVTNQVEDVPGTPGLALFPFANPPTPGDPTWTIQETYFSHTDGTPAGGTTRTTEVWLTNQYTIAQLEADTDALVNSVNPITIAWGSMTGTWYADFLTPNGSAGGDPGGGIGTLNAETALLEIPQAARPVDVFMKSVTTVTNGGIVTMVAPMPGLTFGGGYAYMTNSLSVPFPGMGGWDVAAGYAKWVVYCRAQTGFQENTFVTDLAGNSLGAPVCLFQPGDCDTTLAFFPLQIIWPENLYQTLTPDTPCGQ